MTIYEIDHIQLAMPAGQEEKARAFYTGVLGFTEFPKPDMLANRGGAWFFSATVKIHLGIDANFHAARKAHPAFLVDNLDVMLLKLKQAGIEFDAPQPPLDGYKRVHLFDPFGNRIELMEKA